MNGLIMQPLPMWILRAAAAMLAILFLSIAGATAQTQQPAGAKSSAPPGDATKGKETFQKLGCYTCHGYSGNGSFPFIHSQGQTKGARPNVVGARLATAPQPFPSFVSYVRKPQGRMPAYGDGITDEQLADIYAFLRSVPPSPNAGDIPLLNDPGQKKSELLPMGPGKELVETRCSACHALSIITSVKRTEEEWDRSVKDMVALGAEGSPEEIQIMVDYLRAYF